MEKLQNEMSIDIKVYRGFEKLWYISGNVEGKLIHRAVYMLRKDMNKLSPLTDLEALHKQDVKTKSCQQPDLMLEVFPKTHTESLSKEWETYWFQVYEEISVQSLASQ